MADKVSSSRINFTTYPQDYFTGSQVKVFLGPIWVDDIATIQYQTSQSKVPLYGYNDHQFRAVAKGQFIVKGAFTVAFKETGYLNVVMEAIKKGATDLNEIVKKITKDSTDQKTDTTNRYLRQGLTIEEALDVAAEQGMSNKIRFAGATEAKPNADFEDISEVLEDSIWGESNAIKAVGGRRIPRSDEFDYYKYTGQGDGSVDIDRDGFDILMTFGDYSRVDDNPEHTIISINGVHITGESMVVTPAGEPIGITYEFFARGLNEKVSYAWPVVDQKQSQSSTEISPVSPEDAWPLSQTVITKEDKDKIPSSIILIPDGPELPITNEVIENFSSFDPLEIIDKTINSSKENFEKAKSYLNLSNGVESIKQVLFKWFIESPAKEGVYDKTKTYGFQLIKNNQEFFQGVKENIEKKKQQKLNDERIAVFDRLMSTKKKPNSAYWNLSPQAQSAENIYDSPKVSADELKQANSSWVNKQFTKLSGNVYTPIQPFAGGIRGEGGEFLNVTSEDVKDYAKRPTTKELEKEQQRRNQTLLDWSKAKKLGTKKEE